MKKFLIIAIAILCGSPAWANNTTTINNTVVNPTAIVVDEKIQAGPMFDAPYTVRIFPEWYLGFEGGKDEVYTNTSKGWFGYAKITYTGTLLDFTGKHNDD